jgi:hypothetical protein
MIKIEPLQIPIPMTLYVDKVETSPEFDTRIDRRKTAIDLELNIHTAQNLLAELTKRLEGNTAVGSMRVRFTGRLIS